ncbi:DUF1810 domain-containing protein [Hymenobacter sp. BT491]|uniref:DUF1810 domain-containing protein n=1 Tax=Hymenobacter sp. BT491 TaxID=2766779 RepID=UPI001653DF81|nr:DUF1810 domain-containing protein [Hymenobacter sp. BT491]MBC6992366.1 DUF1810 domain-containing protein [Hymenobacter sp. BT491]
MRPEHFLDRFVDAQEASYAHALAELQQGRKRSHWMWYIFPQLRGLGRSATAQHYGLHDAAEAQAYVQHPLLGPRLLRLCEVLLAQPSRDATAIFGYPDDLKLRSCMTLFAALPHASPVFQAVLDQFFHGKPDPQTLRLLS